MRHLSFIVAGLVGATTALLIGVYVLSGSVNRQEQDIGELRERLDLIENIRLYHNSMAGLRITSGQVDAAYREAVVEFPVTAIESDGSGSREVSWGDDWR